MEIYSGGTPDEIATDLVASSGDYCEECNPSFLVLTAKIAAVITQERKESAEMVRKLSKKIVEALLGENDHRISSILEEEEKD